MVMGKFCAVQKPVVTQFSRVVEVVSNQISLLLLHLFLRKQVLVQIVSRDC